MARVLVVDDEEVYRVCLSRWLTRECHEVRTAASSQEAMRVGAAFHPEVLVVDWMLKSDAHGLEVAEDLQRLNPGLQTIVITGFSSESVRREGRHAHIFRFMDKPFHIHDLAAAVRDAVSNPQAEAGTT